MRAWFCRPLRWTVLAALMPVFSAYAAVEVNQASAAELDSLKGVGPGLSGRILQERTNGPYVDWANLLARIKGLHKASAGKLSAQGLRVNGQPFTTQANDARP